MERLQKLLAQAGIASRRHAEEMILAGRVRVNGKVVTELGTQADPEHDKVMVDNQPVALEGKAYYILNKPRGYISDRDETAELKTALDLVPDGRRLFAAGRLDLMSEGMLLLTNDGELANHLTHPRYEHEKEYLALVHGSPDDKTIERLERGILYDGEWMRADHAERAGRNQEYGEAGRDETWLRIILHEGKKRQIRHMCAALGHAVKRLVRVRMGALRLGTLKVGEWRKLTKDEITQLRQTQERPAQPKQRPPHRAERAAPSKQASPKQSASAQHRSPHEAKPSSSSPPKRTYKPVSREPYRMRGETKRDTTEPRPADKPSRFKAGPRDSFTVRGKRKVDAPSTAKHRAPSKPRTTKPASTKPGPKKRGS